MQARDLGRHIRDLGNLGVQEHKHNKMQEGTNRTRTVRIPQPMLNCNCLAHHPTHALHKMPTRTKMEVKSKCAHDEKHSKQTCNADLYNYISAWFGNVGPGRAGQHDLAEPISHASRRNAEDTSTQEKGNIHELTWAVCVTCCETHLRKPRHMKNQPCTLRT